MNKAQSGLLSNLWKGVVRRISSSASKADRRAGLNWFRIKKLKHLPYGRPGTHLLHGTPVRFNNGQELLHSLQEIFSGDIYRIPFEKANPYIIDCGANIGLSVIYHKLHTPGARVLAFEPDPKNFALLQQNIRAFGFEGVELKNAAIWTDNTTLSFAGNGTLDSSIRAGAPETKPVQVEAVRLKDLLNEPVDFLKLDIEGAEYEVLKDCRDQLHHIRWLFIEFHGSFNNMHELTEILDWVREAGFSFYIKEASNVYDTPFDRPKGDRPYDIQQNIFCFRS